MTEFNLRLKARQEEFMNSFDPKEQLFRREFHAVELRKTKRNELYQLRRAQISNSTRGEVLTYDSLGLPTPTHLLQSLFPALTSPLPFESKVQLLIDILKHHQCDEVTADTLKLLRMYFGESNKKEGKGGYRRDLVQEALWFCGTSSLPHLSEATWLLSNLFSVISDAVSDLLSLGGDSLLLSLFPHPSADVNENLFFCLGNIAGDSLRGCQRLISLHCPELVIAAIKDQRAVKSVKATGSWVLSNLVRYETDVGTVRMIAEMIKVLGREKSKEIRMNVLHSLSFISNMKDEHISVLFSLDLVSPLISLLPRAPNKVPALILRILINIAAGGPRVTQLLLDAEVLDAVHSTLNAEEELVRGRTIELLANVAGGTRLQVDRLVNHPILREAILRLSDSSSIVRINVARVLSNLSQVGTVDHMVTLTSFGVFSILKSGFDHSEPELLLYLLTFVHKLLTFSRTSGHKGLESRFESHGCAEAVAKLQNHCNTAVAGMSVQIQDEFFGGEEERDEGGKQPLETIEGGMETGFVFS